MPFELAVAPPCVPEGHVEVVAYLAPFAPGRRLRARIPAGATVEAIVARFVPDGHVRDHVEVFVGGVHLPRRGWALVRPKVGSEVGLKVTPSDPASIIGLLASVAGGAISTSGIAFLSIGANTFLSAVAGAVVSFAIMAIGQALFGPSNPTRREESPTYAITGARNEARPYGVVPVVLGTHKMVPPYGGMPYTEVAGDDQFLRFLVIWGYGPVTVTDIKIGNTPIDDFDDVEQEHDFDGTATAMELYPSDARQENLSVELGTSYSTRTTPIQTTDIGLTVTFPNGLTRVNVRTGDPSGYIVVLQAQYRQVGAGSWTDWFTEQVGDDTTQTVRFSKRVSGLTRAQYEVRIRRNDIDNASFTPLDGFPDPALDSGYYRPWSESEGRTDILDTAVWTALRSFDGQTAPVSLSGIAKSAFRIRATDQLNGIVDQLNGVVSKLLPVWSGSSWGGSSATSNPAAIYRYVLNGEPNKRPVGGAGLNNQELGAWYEFCETEGFQYDAVHDYVRAVRDVIQDVAAAGRASPQLIDGEWSVVVQQPQTTVRQHFTPRNSRNFQSQMPFVEVPHGLRIRFLNENKGYIEDERIVYDDGYSAANATEFQSIDLPGQTKPRNVYKLGRVFLAAARLRPEVFSLEADIENIVVTRGDLCRIQNDAALIGQVGGRVKSKAGLTVTLDQEVTIESGKQYRLRIRQPDGDTYTSNVLDGPGTYTTLNVSATSGITAGDLFMFGERIPGGESMEVLVSHIEPLDDLAAQIHFVPYSAAFYTAGDVIPGYDPVISDPVGRSFVGPPPPRIDKILTDELALDPTARGDIAPAILLYCTPGYIDTPRNGQVATTTHLRARWRRSDRPNQRFRYSDLVPSGAPIQLTPVRARKSYRVEVQGVSEAGETSEWVVEDSVIVLGLGAPPPQVDDLRSNTIGETIYLEWDYPSIAADVVSYEIRFHPSQNIVEWEKMTVIADDVPRFLNAMPFPAREGTYAIKAVDSGGNFSEAATYANATEDDPPEYRNRTVVTYTEHATFTDAKFNCEVDSSVLVLSDNGYRLDTARAARLIGNGYYYFGVTDLEAVYTFRALVDPKINRISNQSFMSDWVTLSSVLTLGGEASTDRHRVHVEYSYSRSDVDPRYDPESGAGTPDFTKASGDAIDPATEVTRNADFMFVVDLAFPETPTGTILEMGGSTNGLYLGITSGQLVIRAGDGSSRSSTGCAYETQALSNYAGKHGRLYGRIDVSAGSVDLMFTDFDDYSRVFTTGGQVASAGFPSGNWTSTGAGLVGGDSGTIPTGEDGGSFNGTIFAARFYNSTYEPVGAAGPTDWSPWRRIPGRAEVTARHIRFRVLLGTFDTGITPAIEELVARIKTTPVVVTGEDIATTSGSATVTFSPPLEAVRGKPRILGQGLSVGDYYEITNLSRTGFDIDWFDSSDAAIDVTFDYEVRGWGREKT